MGGGGCGGGIEVGIIIHERNDGKGSVRLYVTVAGAQLTIATALIAPARLLLLHLLVLRAEVRVVTSALGGGWCEREVWVVGGGLVGLNRCHESPEKQLLGNSRVLVFCGVVQAARWVGGGGCG